MYQLVVFRADREEAVERLVFDQSAAVLETIPKLLAKHPDCVRIEVLFDSRRLFCVDCHGNRLP